MEIKDTALVIKKLREETGLNRKEFCEYFDISYRTVTEWERGERHAPDYVIRLLAYYIKAEKALDPNAFKPGRKMKGGTDETD